MVTKATNSVLNLTNPRIDEILLNTPLVVDSGGTGKNTITVGRLLVGNGTSAIAEVGAGTAGQVLISNGAGVAPSFGNLDAVTGGILQVPQGGTGRATFDAGALVVGNGTAALDEVNYAAAGLPLVSNGTGIKPSFQAIGPGGFTGVLPVPNGGTGLSSIAAGAFLTGAGTSAPTQTVISAGSVVIGTGGGAPVGAAPGSAGFPLVSQGVGVTPAFSYINLMENTVFGVLSIANAPVQLFSTYTAGSYTYTVGTYTRFLWVEVCGGGGGGAGGNTGGPFTGGGGGAGGYAATWIPVVPGEVVSITVGSGGAGGPGTANGSGNGSNGGSSTVSASGGSVSATGGEGGQSGTNSAGGAGGIGSASVGAIVLSGGYGTDGDITGNEAFGGNGGSSFFGGGLRGARGSPVAGSGAPGAGGGGGYFGAAAGSVGMAGYVILRG